VPQRALVPEPRARAQRDLGLAHRVQHRASAQLARQSDTGGVRQGAGNRVRETCIYNRRLYRQFVLNGVSGRDGKSALERATPVVAWQLRGLSLRCSMRAMCLLRSNAAFNRTSVRRAFGQAGGRRLT
jgi:hypothetical protein